MFYNILILIIIFMSMRRIKSSKVNLKIKYISYLLHFMVAIYIVATIYQLSGNQINEILNFSFGIITLLLNLYLLFERMRIENDVVNKKYLKKELIDFLIIIIAAFFIKFVVYFG